MSAVVQTLSDARLTGSRSEALTRDIQVPGDKSVSHRALILGALASGETRISGLLEGDDYDALIAASHWYASAAKAEGLLLPMQDFLAAGRPAISPVHTAMADVLDAGMRGGVHLQHVDVPAFHDRPAMHAKRRHVDRRAFDRAVGQLVIQGAGKDPRGGRLADPAHAGQHPSLGDAAGGKRIGQRAHHRLLADQLGEIRRTVFARQHAIDPGLCCLQAFWSLISGFAHSPVELQKATSKGGRFLLIVSPAQQCVVNVARGSDEVGGWNNDPFRAR